MRIDLEGQEMKWSTQVAINVDCQDITIYYSTTSASDRV